ncbi:hypothetical protein N7539_008097 [Penicillium diatomitis]|uniref:Uncharacterized protein n=1 Tax=Penicillium diatomitis TaxID=2819901 RepID=A0A9X0BMU7_9EURO|nr:uncharacterized protein N7539_008097 [Penicillium diatomitis]KAJ5475031.1 hypothetical protein N7539_008097 [Penicillium diatomitis]
MTAPPFGEIVRSLSLMPTEMAHAIIEDLRVFDVLNLLVCDDPRVTAAISSHRGCQAVFGTAPGTFCERKELIKKYWALANRIGSGSINFWYRSVIAFNVNCAGLQHLPSILDDLHAHVLEYIKDQTSVVNMNRFTVSSKGIPPVTSASSVAQLEECCTAIREAKTHFLEKASGQLRRACILLENNPDLLKRTMDPDQKPRPNTAHIVARMNFVADKISQSNLQDPVHTEYYRYTFFPVSPFDSSLAELLQMMDHFDIIGGGELLLNKDGSSACKWQHAPAVHGLARVVIDGMAYHHNFWPKDQGQYRNSQVVNKKGDTFRTGNTPWSQQLDLILDESVRGPFFAPHKLGTMKQWNRPRECAGCEPFDDKEEEWLTSFVELYRYLEALKNKPNTSR